MVRDPSQDQVEFDVGALNFYASGINLRINYENYLMEHSLQSYQTMGITHNTNPLQSAGGEPQLKATTHEVRGLGGCLAGTNDRDSHSKTKGSHSEAGHLMQSGLILFG